MRALLILMLLLVGYPTFASQIRMHYGYDRIDEIKADVALATAKIPMDEIWIRSKVNERNMLFQCLTTRKILAGYFADKSFLTLPYEELFKKLSRRNPIFNCNMKLSPLLIKYKGKDVYLYSGILVLDI